MDALSGKEKKEKIVVYAATRRLYHNALVCINSALINGGIDRALLLCEDETLPYKLPDRVQIMDVSKQTYFRKYGPNYSKYWTYMTMMRLALSKLLPDCSRALWLDCDTIVKHDISELWDLDMTDHYFAAVREPRKSTDSMLYINAGVLMCNLEKLRADGMDDFLIREVDTRDYDFVDQGCIVRNCQGHILELPGRFNKCRFTQPDEETYIRHFAANGDWVNGELYKQYDTVEVLNE